MHDESRNESRNTGARGGVGALVTPSPELSAIVGGSEPLARSEVTSRVWTYIKANHLQNPNDKREIVADAALEAVLGRKRVTMFELPGLLNAHMR